MRSTPPIKQPNRRRTVLLVSTGFLILFAGYALWCASVPDGTYPDANISAEGGARWIFSKGEIRLEADGRSMFVGVYWKTNNGWVYGPVLYGVHEGTLKPEVFGIRMLSTSKPHTSVFLPRVTAAWFVHSRLLSQESTNGI